MPRMSQKDLEEYVVNILRDPQFVINSIPAKTASDIRRILSGHYGIHYKDNRNFSKKMYRMADDSDLVNWTYVGNTMVYFLEDWKEFYYKRDLQNIE